MDISKGFDDVGLDAQHQLAPLGPEVGRATATSAHTGSGADLFDSPLPTTGERKTTTRKEIWAWYIYYIGNSGLGPFNFAISAWQNLLYLAGEPCGDDVCLDAYGSLRTINSIVLITNGLSFAIQAVLFLAVGSFADYGTWRPWITIVFTVLGVATSFAWLGVMQPDQWQAGTALYIIGLIAYQGALTFWSAAFPGLARDLPETQESVEDLKNGLVSQETHDVRDSLARNRLSNVSFFVSSVGELAVLAVLAGILIGIKSGDSVENNTRAFSVVCAYSGGIWAACAVPWFLMEQRRPGYQLPPGASYLTVGFSQLATAAKLSWRLKQTTIYLVAYFLLGDCLNTTVTVIATLQTELAAYSTQTLNYLLIDGIAAQALGIGLYWVIQKRWKIPTKTLLLVVAFFILVLDAWGCVGITQTKFGFKNLWEIWLYQAYYGVAVCAWYAVSQTMISEVAPRGKEMLFFAVFSVVGKTSAFIGPFVSAAIIDRTGNNSMPFAFLLALGTVATAVLWFVDVPKSRIECRRYLEDESRRLYEVDPSFVAEEEMDGDAKVAEASR